MTRAEFAKTVAMECPLALFQVRGSQQEAWATLHVWCDPDEVDQFVAMQRYRYPDADREVRWRVYVVYAMGRLRD